MNKGDFYLELLNEDECRCAYELNGNYTVLSQIDNYQKDINYPYLKNKKAVGFNSYCSKAFVVDKAELKKILQNAGILS